ncbi:MAG: hypothetical protein KKE20_04395 [Nanoarchaeota archaeon]|nr:hypothetical protein [Nanoarchaeota archaeon]
MLTTDYTELKRGYALTPENPNRDASLLSLLTPEELAGLEYDPKRKIYIYEETKGKFPAGKLVHVHPEQGVAFEIENTSPFGFIPVSDPDSSDSYEQKPGQDGITDLKKEPLLDRGLATHILIDGEFRTICCSLFRPFDYLHACSESHILMGQLERFIYGGFPHLTHVEYPVKGEYIFTSKECTFGEKELRINRTGFSFPRDYSGDLFEKMLDLSNTLENLKKQADSYHSVSISSGANDMHALALDLVHQSTTYSPIIKHELSLMIMMNLRMMQDTIDSMLEAAPELSDSETVSDPYGIPMINGIPHPALLEKIRFRQSPGIFLRKRDSSEQ